MSEKFRLDRKIGFRNTFYTKCINVIIDNIGPSIILMSIFFHKRTEYHLYRQLLQELSNQGLRYLQSVYKSVKRCLCKVNGYGRIAVQQVLITFQLVSFISHTYQDFS